MSKQACSNCQQDFECANNSSCWCFDLPPILEFGDGSCLCYDCTLSKVKKKISEIISTISPEDALQNNPYKLLPKSKALIEDIDYYEENGFFVFTAWYLLKRGYCCNNGCRHCVYK